MLHMEYGPTFALLAHELRSPAAVIGGYARMLREGRLDDAARQQACIQIERAAGLISVFSRQASSLGRWLGPDPGRMNDPRPLTILIAETLASVTSSERIAVEFGTGAESVLVGCLDRQAWTGALASVIDSVRREGLNETIRVIVRVSDPVMWCEILVADGRLTAVVDLADAATGTPVALERGGQGLALVLADAVFQAHDGRLWAFGDRRGNIAIRLPTAAPA